MLPDAVRPEPPAVIDAREGTTQAHAAAQAVAADAGRLLIGVASGAPPDLAVASELTLTLCDVAIADRRVVTVADVDAAAAELVAAAERNPDAASVLAAHLRHSALLPVGAALVAESTAYSMLQAGPEHAGWLRANLRRDRPDDPQRVELRREGDTLHVRLDRVARRNAFDAAMRDALLEALAVAAADPDVRVELSAAGPTFCSGGDLDEFGTTDNPVRAHLLRTSRSVGLAIHRIADRVTAVVHGSCVGAGVELPAFASRVVAAAGTTFRLPEVAMGLIPGAGGTVSITRRIGRWRGAWLALSGAELDAATALSWGLVDDIA